MVGAWVQEEVGLRPPFDVRTVVVGEGVGVEQFACVVNGSTGVVAGLLLK